MVQMYAISLILLVATAVGSTPVNTTSNLVVNFEIVGNISEYKRTHPDIILTILDVNPKISGIIKHTLGKRTPWDRVIAQASKSNSFLYPQNVQAILTYPANGGYGERVTFVEVNVRQTSDSGRAYITSGGIGQRQIRIVVEGQNTMQFDYTATLFSSASQMQSFSLLVSLVSLFFFSSSIFKL